MLFVLFVLGVHVFKIYFQSYCVLYLILYLSFSHCIFNTVLWVNLEYFQNLSAGLSPSAYKQMFTWDGEQFISISIGTYWGGGRGEQAQDQRRFFLLLFYSARTGRDLGKWELQLLVSNKWVSCTLYFPLTDLSFKGLFAPGSEHIFPPKLLYILPCVFQSVAF